MSLEDQEPTGSLSAFCRRLYSNWQELVFLQVHSHFQGTVTRSPEMPFLGQVLRTKAASLSSVHSGSERSLVPGLWASMAACGIPAQKRTRITILKPSERSCYFHPFHPHSGARSKSSDSLKGAGQASRNKVVHFSLAAQCGPTGNKARLLPPDSHSRRRAEKMPLIRKAISTAPVGDIANTLPACLSGTVGSCQLLPE